jgi:hypothetical protein
MAKIDCAHEFTNSFCSIIHLPFLITNHDLTVLGSRFTTQ